MPTSGTIDRFTIIRTLATDSWSSTYLAHDPRLKRQVIVVLLAVTAAGEAAQYLRRFEAARVTSKLKHPNIVPVSETGNFTGQPYLVFEYAQGVPLGELLATKSALPVLRAGMVMSLILRGIAYAHRQGFVHQHLSPSVIHIGPNDSPRLLGFGISSMVGPHWEMAGKVTHPSPEHLSGAGLGPPADIFSLGLIFHEMLTGRPAFEAPTPAELMQKIRFRAPVPPSTINEQIPPGLDAIVLKALAKAPADRYRDALAMKKELDRLLRFDTVGSEPVRAGTASHSTVEFLLRRIRHSRDFPAFSQHIAEINQKSSASASNHTSASQLADVILKDFSLTSKLLRLVNSAFYRHSSGKITTVSRAVVVLGFKQVRLAAASLMLFDHLQNQDQAMELKEAAISSFMSGLIARDLAGRLGIKSIEESFICAMLHNVGKHLVIFYLPEEYVSIKFRMAQREEPEGVAARAVLGVSLEDLGKAVLKSWTFPDMIVDTLTRLEPGRVAKPKSEAQALCCICNFSNELCDIVRTIPANARSNALASLSKRFHKLLAISESGLKNLLIAARDRMEEYSDTLCIDVNQSDFLRSLVAYSSFKRPAAVAVAGEVTEGLQYVEAYDAASGSQAGPSPNGTAEDNLSVLINGIQEITNALLEDYQLNDLMVMILETMYRGFSFDQIVFFLMDGSRRRMNIRYAFGASAELVNENFGFPVTGSPSDIFNMAICQGKGIMIENAEAPVIKPLIPDWYRENFTAPAFIIYPLVVKETCLGLYYADRREKGCVLSDSQLTYLKTLRNQAALAIKQRST